MLLNNKSHNTLSIRKDWFVIKTYPRHEKKVNSILQNYGYKTYLPLIETIRIWSDRKKKVITPLIPSMLFVQDIHCNKELIYLSPGFHSILKENGKIGVVRPEEIEQLKIIIGENELEYDTVKLEKFKSGDKVEIVGGPLKGFIATALEEVNSYRVLISIPTVGIGYGVNIAKSYIRKIK